MYGGDLAAEDRIVFLVGHRKSGTSMFLNLFDGHPEITAYPIDLNVLYGYYPQYVREELPVDKRRSRLDRVIFDDLYQFSELVKTLDIERMRQQFHKLTKGDSLDCMKSIISAQIQSFRIAHDLPSNKMIMVKETSVEIYASEIFDWFPNAQMIHLVRDPRDNYAAILAGLKRYEAFSDTARSLLMSVVERVRLGFLSGEINSRKFGPEKYRILRFEDLVKDTHGSLEKLISWLGVAMSSSLLRPTKMGETTIGNNYDKMAFSSISDRNLGRWRDRIPEEDARLIEALLAPEMASFNYTPAFAIEEASGLIADYYKWLNYNYMFYDRFAQPMPNAPHSSDGGDHQ